METWLLSIRKLWDTIFYIGLWVRLTCIRSCEIDDNILFIHIHISMQILTKVGTDSATVPRRSNHKEKRNNSHNWNGPSQQQQGTNEISEETRCCEVWCHFGEECYVVVVVIYVFTCLNKDLIPWTTLQEIGWPRLLPLWLNRIFSD